MAPELVNLARLDAQAFGSLLEAESRVWHDAMLWDYTASAEMISSCLRAKNLSGYALLEKGRVTGYSFFFCEGVKGLIGDLFVEPDGTGLKAALSLLGRVLGTLFEMPDLRRAEAQLPHFTLEQLAPSFNAHCFQAYLRRFMVAPLARRASRDESPCNTPPSSESDGRLRFGDFSLGPWQRKHDREAARLLLESYRNHIDALINDQYASLEGVTRLVDNIVHHRGCGQYLPTASLAAVHRASQKLAGIMAMTAVRSRTAHIPQIAVAREFQGSGLGTALIEASVREVARMGFDEVSLTVTDLNAGAVRLYERLGFGTFRTFGAFVWNRP